MNITQLNFSDSQFSELLHAYIHILMRAIHIDNKVDKKELWVVFSLITWADAEWDMSFLSSLNFIKHTHNIDSKYLVVDGKSCDFIKTFDLENIIFHEASKILHQIIASVSEPCTKTFNQKMQDLETDLASIKRILESKQELLWQDYIEVFYYGLYFYSECIAKQAWKLFWNNIVPEEKKYLETIKSFLNVDWPPSESQKEALRKTPLTI